MKKRIGFIFAFAMVFCLALSLAACDLGGGDKNTKEYTVTYNGGTHGGGEINAGTKEHGADFTLSTSKYTRAGYTQTGWAKTDGGAKAFELGGVYKDNADITLYPFWAQNAAGAEDDLMFTRGVRPVSYSLKIESVNNMLVAQPEWTTESIRTPDGYFQRISGPILGMMAVKSELWILDGGSCSYKRVLSGAGEVFTNTDTMTRGEGESEIAVVSSEICDWEIWRLNSEQGDTERKGSDTYLGRDCAIFVYDATEGGMRRRCEYWVDKATGCCLKFKEEQWIGGEYFWFTHTVMEYSLNSVTLPNL